VSHLVCGAVRHCRSRILADTRPGLQLDERVVRAAALLEALQDMDDPYESEHVTPHLYRRPDELRIHDLVAERDDAALDPSLDAEQAARLIEGARERVERPHRTHSSAEVTALAQAVRAA
jgi:spore coat polysaccharide biosynthesis protein SpsF (cytidylyltransferase family)